MQDVAEALIRGNMIHEVQVLTKSSHTKHITNLNQYVCIS